MRVVSGTRTTPNLSHFPPKSAKLPTGRDARSLFRKPELVRGSVPFQEAVLHKEADGLQKVFLVLPVEEQGGEGR